MQGLSFVLFDLPASLSPQDYHRPSVEEILESPLIADLVAEEQRRYLERRGRRSGEPVQLRDSSPVLSELKLKERQLQEREQALRAREDSLERECCLEPGSQPTAVGRWGLGLNRRACMHRLLEPFVSF